MRFAAGYYIYGFWIVFAVVLCFVWAHRNKKAALKKFAEGALLKEITPSVNFNRQVLKSAVISVVLLLSVLALMRPQWGFRWEEVKRRGLDILVAIDVSKSMLAADVKPDRLERSKLAVKDLVKKLKGDRIGLIAFAGTAYLQCPLTIDYSGFLLALNDLSVNTIPRGGTSISSAIGAALDAFRGLGKAEKALIVITDGENHEGDPFRLAEKAKEENIKIFTIGIGTKAGDLIQVVDKDGQRAFLKDAEGNVVKSRLNEGVLQKIALITGGTYIRSSGAEFGLEIIYDEKLSRMEKREIKAKMNKFYHERFQIPLALALILLITESFISDKRKI